MNTDAQHWEQLYNQTPLIEVKRRYESMRASPFLMEYLATVLKLCPQNGRTVETGIGSGYGAIWLSKRNIHAHGLDYSPGIVERARHVNNILEGSAAFRVGDLFDLYRDNALDVEYDVIHHQGVLEHFNLMQIRAALAQQVASARAVVFSVPSVNYPYEPEFGDERLLTLDAWKYVLEPFDIAELRYYGDPALGAQEHVLCVLNGQRVTDELRALMTIPEEPFPEGVTVIIHARNEERHIGDCIRSVQPWGDEVIVCDMESEDRTVDIAAELGARIVHHPRVKDFDRSRNLSGLFARFKNVMYLDADERAPAGLGPALKAMITERGHEFSALLLPFRHIFCGHWMQCLYPGYTAPRVFKNGKFVFRSRLHSGARVDGPVIAFPADDPELALIHYSFDSMSHYLDKLNRYTDGEAAAMHTDGKPFHWQNAVSHFVADFQAYYDNAHAGIDGVHGFIYAFQSGFYRFYQTAKLFELRAKAGQVQPQEQAIPASVEEVLEFALQCARRKPLPQAAPIRLEANAGGPASTDTADDSTAHIMDVVWSGPLNDPSGYGEESRNFVHALDLAEVPVAAHSLHWSADQADMPERDHGRLAELSAQAVKPGFVQIVQNFPPGIQRHPQASMVIGRSMFETDRLPQNWLHSLNRLDYVWVPSEFNRRTFADAGVAREKLAVIPGCFDPLVYQQTYPATALTEDLKSSGRFQLLTVFDWSLHKGWDLLLRGFLEAFEGRDDVGLVLKVWSTMGYTPESLQEQAREYCRKELGHDLAADPRIRFVTDRLSQPDLLALCQACDAFVLPSRGEGWGRPFMEAMALGKLAIGTNWSGNAAFMNVENSYLVDCEVADVPEIGWREIPTYRGHRWAEPNRDTLIHHMRQVVSEPEQARLVGLEAKQQVTERFNRLAVGKLMAAEIARVQEIARPHPVLISEPVSESTSNHTNGKTPVAPLTVRWEGGQFSRHSLAHVNREFCLGLLNSGRVDLSLVPTEPNHFSPDEDPRFRKLAPLAFRPQENRAQVHVRHFFPPRLETPDEGHFVLIQPWEYGYLPEDWIEPIRNNVREVWCYGSYVRDAYLNSGIAEEKLKIVPLGVDTEVFHPEAPTYVFTAEAGSKALTADRKTNDRFTFLFVGGTIHRKGIDILLDAYLKAFSAYDDVCLVIKDTGTNTVYRGANEKERILGLVDDPTRPPIVYFDDDISAHQLAGIYTSSQCLVQPYRGEGFCLPALEAMACGVPVIVPEGGPTDDFIDSTVGWRLPAERRLFNNGRIGEWDCVGPTWMFEISPGDLGRAMREVFHNRQEASTRGQEAVRRVQTNWTWKHSSAAALSRIEALAELPVIARASAIHAVNIKTALAASTNGRSTPRGAVTNSANGKSGSGAGRPNPIAAAQSPNGTVTPTANGSIPTNGKKHKGSKPRRNAGAPSPVETKPVADTIGDNNAAEHNGYAVNCPSLDVASDLRNGDADGRSLADLAANGVAVVDRRSSMRSNGAENTSNGDDRRRSPLGGGFFVAGHRRKTPTISLCMIARNEERVLDPCLTSAKPYVDEIIFVDTGSDDRTVEIAKSHGVKLYHSPWENDFSKARNVSLEHAAADWILWIDCDDTLPEHCGRKLHDLVMMAEEKTAGFIMRVHIPPAPGEDGLTIVDHVKLFRNRPYHRFERRIHEQIMAPIRRNGGAIERGDLFVVHSGYDYSPEGQRRKHERDLTILELERAERPNDPFTLFNIGMTANHLKDFPKAIEALDHCLAVSGKRESTVRKVYAMLAGAHLALHDLANSRRRLEEGLARHPNDPELLFRAGVIYRDLGDLQASERSYIKLLSAPEIGHIDSLDVTMAGFKAHHNLALVYRDQNRPSEAEQHFDHAVRLHPRFAPSWLGLGELYVRLRRFEDARNIVNRLTEIDPTAAATLAGLL